MSHTSKAGEFDTLDQVLKSAKAKQSFFVPGEHDTSFDDGKMYMERHGKNAKGRGWFSFNHKDVHFVGLSNVAALEGLGKLGPDQLEWLEADLQGQPASRPVVVFAHIPLWSVYPEWGWGTEDSAQALGYLKRFGARRPARRQRPHVTAGIVGVCRTGACRPKSARQRAHQPVVRRP